MSKTFLHSKNDKELFIQIKEELYSALIGDVMDTAGLTHQCLPPQIKPLQNDMIIIGRAMPVLEADCHGEDIFIERKRKPFGLMFEALDDLKPDEVYICSGGSPTYALWGELMSTRATKLGVAGAVLNGYSRDTRRILRLGFPTFSWGTYAQDQRIRGRVIDYRCNIEFSNRTIVQPGDIIFGDLDGVLVIPQKYEKDIISLALEKARGENLVRKALERGMSCKRAFKKFNIM